MSWTSAVDMSALEPESGARLSSLLHHLTAVRSCASALTSMPQVPHLFKIGLLMLQISQDGCEHSNELIQADQSLANNQEALGCITFN